MSEQSPRMDWVYPSMDDDPWYDVFLDFVNAIDGSGFASREDRSVIWSGGGLLSWTLSSETFEWTGTINIYSPMSGKLIQIAADSITGWSDGEIVYVDITRLALVNTAKTLQKSTALPSTDDAMAFAVRIGNILYFRTGMSLSDGDSTEGVAPVPGSGSALEVEDDGSIVDTDVDKLNFKGLGVTATQASPGVVDVTVLGGGGSSDKRTAAIIVGNSLEGDTADRCDYLDIGNGAQLQAALTAAASVGFPVLDVYIRPGIYDLGAAGASGNALSVPERVRVKGAGRQQVAIKTRADGGGGGAFVLNGNNVLEDVFVTIPELTLAQDGSEYAIIESSDGGNEIRRVTVEFESSWASVDPNDVSIGAVVGIFSGVDGKFTLDDFEIIGGPLFNYLHFMYGIEISAAKDVYINNIKTEGLDTPFSITGGGEGGVLSNFTFRDSFRNGINVGNHDKLKMFSGIIVVGSNEDAFAGIITYSSYASIGDVVVETVGSNTFAIEIVSCEDVTVTGCKVIGDWNNSVYIHGLSSTKAIVSGNFTGGKPILDEEGNSEIVHNF